MANERIDTYIDSTAVGRQRRLGRGTLTLRLHLLLGINIVMAMLLSAALIWDYQREFAHRLAEKRVALDAEAKAIAVAVPELKHHGTERVQALLDRFCGGGEHLHVSGHHVLVQWGETVLQPSGHAETAAEVLTSLRNTIRQQDEFGQLSSPQFVVSRRESNGVAVYVAESTNEIRREVRRDSLGRLMGLALTGVVAAIVLDWILLGALIRPVEQLSHVVRRIADGNLGTQVESFRTAELELLGRAVNTMSLALRAYDQERRTQLNKAHQLQEHLLSHWPSIPGLDLRRHFIPATEVSGDHHEVVQLNDANCLIAVADVTGHGVAAAMGAAMLKTLILQAARETSQPDELLSLLNERFAKVVLPGDFASMFLLRWNNERASLTYASAGHLPGLLLRSDGTLEVLDSTGTMIGIAPDLQWSAKTLTLAAGDRLLLLTDGVSELFNAEGEMFGFHQVMRLLQLTRGAALDDVLPAFRSAMDAHRKGLPFKDDVTLLVIECQCPRIAARSVSTGAALIFD